MSSCIQSPMTSDSKKHPGSRSLELHGRSIPKRSSMLEDKTKEAKNIASRRPQSPFMLGLEAGSHAQIPQLRFSGEKSSPRKLRNKATSPTPAVTAALEMMSIDSPTMTLTRDFFDSRTEPPSHALTLPSRGGRRRRLSLQTSFGTTSPGRASSRSPLVKSALCRSTSAASTPPWDGGSSEGEPTRSPAAYPVLHEPEVTTLIPNPLHPMRLGQLPVLYTRERLKEVGRRYLSDSRSADAFIRAAPLPPPPSEAVPKHRTMSNDVKTKPQGLRADDPTNHGASTRMEYVKIRIFPCSPARKPFCISKKFPVRAAHHHHPPSREAARNSRPYRVEKRHHRHYHHHTHGTIGMLDVPVDAKSRRRSESDIAAMLEMTPPLEPVSEDSYGCGMKVTWPEYPIHIEYALYRVPLLAAILNSGFVHKGDTAEVPLPYPEAWEDTVRWIYLFEFPNSTDDGLSRREEDANTEKVKCNVEYLGGKLD